MLTYIRNAIWASYAHGLPHVIVSNLLQQGVGFLTVLVIAKLLPPQEFAMVRIAMAYAAVGTIVAAGGLTAPVLRYCADTKYGEQPRREMLGFSILRLGVVAAVTVAVALLLAAAKQGSAVEGFVLASYALQLPGLAAASLFLVYFQATQQFKTLARYQAATRVASFAAVSGATYLYGLTGLLVATVATVYATCILMARATDPILHLRAPDWLPADFKHLAYYSLIGMVVSTFGQYVDLMLLDWLGTDKGLVAVYALATIFFFAISAMAGAAQAIATPAFTALIFQPARFERQLHRWSLLLFAAGLVASALVVGFAIFIERYVLTDAYEGLGQLVAIMMIRFCIWCTYAIGGAALVGIGAIRQGVWIAAVTTTATLVVGFPLCQRYGIFGAAWTQVLIAVLTAGLVWWLIGTELRKMKLGDSAGQSDE